MKKPNRSKQSKRSKKPKVPERPVLMDLVLKVLDDFKAQSVVSLDVRHLSSITDAMVIASGRSNRHVRSVAQALAERCKEDGFEAIGVEGQQSGEWVLVDLGDVVVHVMQPEAREFYSLEKLWDIAPSKGKGELG